MYIFWESCEYFEGIVKIWQESWSSSSSSSSSSSTHTSVLGLWYIAFQKHWRELSGNYFYKYFSMFKCIQCTLINTPFNITTFSCFSYFLYVQWKNILHEIYYTVTLIWICIYNHIALLLLWHKIISLTIFPGISHIPCIFIPVNYRINLKEYFIEYQLYPQYVLTGL